MLWIAPTEKDADNAALEKRLWDAADQFHANSGLIFLRFTEVRFAAERAKLEKSATSSRRGSRLDGPAAYHAGPRDAGLLGHETKSEVVLVSRLRAALDEKARQDHYEK